MNKHTIIAMIYMYIEWYKNENKYTHKTGLKIEYQVPVIDEIVIFQGEIG